MWHAAAANVTVRKRAVSLPPCGPRRLPRPLGEASSFSASSLEGRRIDGGRRVRRSGPFLGGTNSRGLQGRLGTAPSRPLRGGMDEGSSGGLYRPRCGGLNRWSRTGDRNWTQLGGSETYPWQLAACVQDRINMRNHAFQHRPETIHRLVRRIPQPLSALSPLFPNDPGVQRTQHNTRRRLRTDIVTLRRRVSALLLQQQRTYIKRYGV